MNEQKDATTYELNPPARRDLLAAQTKRLNATTHHEVKLLSLSHGITRVRRLRMHGFTLVYFYTSLHFKVEIMCC